MKMFVAVGWMLMLLGVVPAAFTETQSKTAAIGPLEFLSVLPPSDTQSTVSIAPFRLDVVPVDNARFLQFIQANPQWQRGNISGLFADENYLSHWSASTDLAAGQEKHPVVHVSWFAATAYCESLGGRLPRWYEWEAAAAAGPTSPDARQDAHWRQQILNWYARSGGAQLPDVGKTEANYYGIRDLHGVIWEWVEDYNGMLVGSDNREQGGADKLEFCGTGALGMKDKENYAILMRIALLSSLEAHYTTRNLGFRCAYDID